MIFVIIILVLIILAFVLYTKALVNRITFFIANRNGLQLSLKQSRDSIKKLIKSTDMYRGDKRFRELLFVLEKTTEDINNFTEESYTPLYDLLGENYEQEEDEEV